MRLSTRARYALRMMLDIAKHQGEDKPVSLSSVAERTGLSHGYLEQLATVLRNARILRGVSGRHGGYLIAKPVASISVGEIVGAAIGPICIVDCLEDPDACTQSGSCECRVLYSQINLGIREVIHRYTLADMLDGKWLAGNDVVADKGVVAGKGAAAGKRTKGKPNGTSRSGDPDQPGASGGGCPDWRKN